MSLDINIVDPQTGTSAAITSEHALCLQDTGIPPLTQIGNIIIFRQFLTTTGISTGSNNMLVNGSSTNVDFSVNAQQKKDTFITSINFVIADMNPTLNLFGAITALTNGCKLVYEDQNGEVIISDQLTSNWEFVRLCQGNPAFSEGVNSAFRAKNVFGTVAGYLPTLDFRATFGLRWGIRLRAGTGDKIKLVIRDDVSGIDQFDCIAYGFSREAL